MADLDLKSALEMFTQGAQSLGFQRALSDANDQVQQVKSSELNEMQQRAALNQISNQLVQHLSVNGVDPQHIAQLSQTISPTYSGANQMYEAGLQKGDQNLMQSAKQAQVFEQKPAIDLQNIRYIQARKLQNEAQLPEKLNKAMVNVNNKIDPNVSKFGNLAKLQGVNNQIKDGMTMLDDPKMWTPTALAETVRKLDAILSQGSATVTGSEHLTPKISAKYAADLKQLITNKPQVMEGADSWRQYYQNIFNRIQGINQNIIQEGQLDYLRGIMPSMVKEFGSLKQEMTDAISNKLGVPVTILPNNDIDLTSNVEKQNQYKDMIAQMQANPSDPRISQVVQKMSSDDRNLKRLFLREPTLASAFKKFSKAGK